jgi:thiamine-monophosphate kinase
MSFSELKWVEYLKKKTKRGKGVIAGIGDDCALISLGCEKFLLKSDLFVEGVHFPAVKRRGLALPAFGRRGGKQEKISFKTIGMRAVARVLSDFAACAGLPKFIGISLGMPSSIKDRQLKEILSGVLFMSKKYDFSLIGGDTGKAPALFLDVWGVGVTEKFISRSGAKAGDYIFISGKLGSREFNKVFEPRIQEAQYLVHNFKVNAMIDISDGFVLDLHRLLSASDKGALLIGEQIPVTKGESDVYRGEDYELIFTVDKNDPGIETLKKKFYLVGRVTSKKYGFKIKRGAREQPVFVKGYTHF